MSEYWYVDSRYKPVAAKTLLLASSYTIYYFIVNKNSAAIIHIIHTSISMQQFDTFSPAKIKQDV